MNLNLVSENLLFSNSLQYDHLFSLLEKMSLRYLDYADLYFQSIYYESWIIENGIIKEGSYHIDQGVGVRAIKGEKTGFSYANQINFAALNKSAIAASSIINEVGRSGQVQALDAIDYKPLYSNLDPINSISREEKIALLYRIDKEARSTDKRITEVIARLSGSYEQILVAANDGTLAADIRPLVLLSIIVQVEQDGKRERGTSGGGGRFGYDFFLKEVNGEILADSWVREAVRMAITNLSAVAAPAGAMSVVLGSGWPGVLLHEAVGHGLEGDFNRRGSSIFSGQIGNIVASEICTVVDDSTILSKRGSLAIDDEGVPGQYNILIEKGRLKGFMQDKLNSRLMGGVSTGNGRRESYAHLPIPRMTNTYMLAGKSTPEEIIASVDRGIYATNLGGGQVDITSGKFVFSTSEAYLIKNGRVTLPIKGATIIGSGIEIMQQISMVGNDLSLDNGVGICVKEGQNLPVGVGQPTLKLDKITVGGTD